MSTYHHPDDRPSDTGPLWDAGAGVCCAAFQLGACAHTEGEDYDPRCGCQLANCAACLQDELDDEAARQLAVGRVLVAALVVPADDPF